MENTPRSSTIRGVIRLLTTIDPPTIGAPFCYEVIPPYRWRLNICYLYWRWKQRRRDRLVLR